MKSRFATLQPFAFLAIEFNFYEVLLKLPPTKFCIWQRMGRSRLETPPVHGSSPESARIMEHGPGQFEQEPLAKAFGKNKKKPKSHLFSPIGTLLEPYWSSWTFRDFLWEFGLFVCYFHRKFDGLQPNELWILIFHPDDSSSSIRRFIFFI